MSATGKHIFSPRRAARDRIQSACSCGWTAIGTDKTDSSAINAWEAHLYAKGLRTKAQIAQATA